MNQTRREFLKASALTGAGIWLAESRAKCSPNDTVNFACIGVGGKGGSDTADAARLGNLVAICDVDENTLRSAGVKYPMAKQFTDYRKMLDEMGKSIDAVTVSTPDHHHAIVTWRRSIRSPRRWGTRERPIRACADRPP